LFCGQGEYENGGEGSSLVSLRQIKDTYYTSIAKKPIKKLIPQMKKGLKSYLKFLAGIN